MRGRYSLVYFGFSNCPDACIYSTDGLAQAYETLTPEERKNIHVYFFSFDTMRDTPEKLKAYLSAFNEDFIGVSGYDHKDEMEKVLKSFGVVTDRDGHSILCFLLDEDVRFVTQYNYQTMTDSPEQIAADLRRIWKQRACPIEK